MKRDLNDKVEKLIIGFSVGVMLAASIWSLILPSLENSKNLGYFLWVPATIGFVLGILFLILVNYFTNICSHKKSNKKLDMLMFSVTLHNIPEGMAVGVCYVGFLAGNMGISLLSATILAVGIAIQNIPEGAIISIPMNLREGNKKKSFIYGMLSGIVEPIASIITILLINIIRPILPYLLSFAAGAMIYVVMEELVPVMNKNKKSIFGTIGYTVGFVLMMVLDVVLS